MCILSPGLQCMHCYCSSYLQCIYYIILVVCLLLYTDYSNSGFQQNVPYGSYPPASQQAAMATSYPSYSVPSSVSNAAVYTTPSQVSVPSATTYNYATGQIAAPYAVTPPVQTYTAYQVPAAPASSTPAAAPPAVADPTQYGRPPAPPPMPNQQTVSLQATAFFFGSSKSDNVATHISKHMGPL